MKDYSDLLVYFGSAIKVSDQEDGSVELSGLAVVFDDDGKGRDVQGDYFTSKTYFGAAAKSGTLVADGLFHHGLPISRSDPRAVKLAETILGEVKMTRTDDGWLASLVLPMRESYEGQIVALARAGKLGWSTGSSGFHAKHVGKDGSLKGWTPGGGEIARWPIVEVSLTPTPAEPRTYAVPLKSLLETVEVEDPIVGALRTINANHDLARALRQVA